MKNLVNFDTPWKQPNICDVPVDEPSPENQRLEEIRRISNIIQALENVVAQAEGNPDFADMRDSLLDFLTFSKQKLMRSIHQR